MGNSKSNEQPSNETDDHECDENYRVFSDLINMGFNESLALQAATKHPDDLNRAIDCASKLQEVEESNNQNNNDALNGNGKTEHKMENEENMDGVSRSRLQEVQKCGNQYDDALNDNDQKMGSVENHSHNEENINCGDIEKCVSFHRLSVTLRVYKKYHDNNNISHDLSEYIDLHQKHIINDYHHILETHLNQFKYIYQSLMKHDLLCDVSKCKIYSRNQRDRELQKQHNVFDGTEINDKNVLIYMDILDCIHCYFMHSVDTGYTILNDKYSVESLECVEDNKNDFSDKQLSKLRGYVKDISGRNGREMSKFMSRVSPIESVENNDDVHQSNMLACDTTAIDNDSNKETHSKAYKYNLGKRYDYWDKQPHRYNYKHLKPKYDNFKEELISNVIYAITKPAFYTSYEKARQLMTNSNKIKTTKCDDYHCAAYYGIQEGQNLSIYHVLSIIFYCDYTALSFNFSSTFRRTNKNERHKDLIKKNQQYGNWTKILTETVNCYGNKMEHASFNVLYHGISYIYFDCFIAQFNSPTSTTTELIVATRFATDNGIILELTKNNTARGANLRYFNCVFISNFANEHERLFIQPPYRDSYHLKFVSIRNVSTEENYKEVISTLAILEEIFIPGKNYNICSNLSDSTIKLINDFFRLSLSPIDGNDMYPEYIRKTFAKWRNRQTKLRINIKNILDHCKGIEIIDDEYENLLKFDELNRIFRNIQKIRCYWTGLVDVVYLRDMVNEINKLKYSRLKQITLHQVQVPMDFNISELKQLFKVECWNIVLLQDGFGCNLKLLKNF